MSCPLFALFRPRNIFSYLFDGREIEWKASFDYIAVLHLKIIRKIYTAFVLILLKLFVSVHKLITGDAYKYFFFSLFRY